MDFEQAGDETYSYLQELNEVQRKAVEHTDGPTLIIAGPGSGKTRVLTYRIGHLIQKGADPFGILALTFTNKAAREMQHRIEKIAGQLSRNLYMGTFHSVFARILRVEAQRIGYPSNFTIYDTDDAKSLIKSIIKEMNLDDKIYKPNQVLYRISGAKNDLISPEDYARHPELLTEDEQAKRPQLHQIYKAYAARCFRNSAMDFDDLLLKTHEILQQFPEVLHRYQHKFRYVLIDEFQDTNPLQYAIVKSIADVFQNITVVGDDAQSIYGFRGATINNILDFERDFPDLEVFKLEQNYRSTQNIVKAANELIHHNKKQLKKKIWTSNDGGDPIWIARTASDNEEGRFVADSIQELRMREHYHLRHFAVLYRTHAQSRAMEEALRRAGIAYKIYGGLSFFQRKEVKDVLAYLRLTVNPSDDEALKRVINYPGRGIGQTTIDKIQMIATHEGRTLWGVLENIMQQTDISLRTRKTLEQFVYMIGSFQATLNTKNAWELAQHIVRTTGLQGELSQDKTVEGVSRFENMQELLNGIKEWVEEDVVQEGEHFETDRGLGHYLQNIALLTGEEEEKGDKDSVKMMTIHSAKGLEFPVVYVVGLEESLFPSMQSLYSMDDLEEERRLFYVAITRAEKKLYLTWAATRYRYGKLEYGEPSRFIQEIPKEVTSIFGELKRRTSSPSVGGSSFQRPVLKTPPPARPVAGQQGGEPFIPDDTSALDAGMRVIHEKFGGGVVTRMDGVGINRMATIEFDELGIKKIMLKFAKLKITG